MKKYAEGGKADKDEKDEKGNRTKYIESFPDNVVTRSAAKVSGMLDKMGFRQDETFKDKTAKKPIKRAKGGMVTARGQGKVMKKRGCKIR
jgi:hypothetical protein